MPANVNPEIHVLLIASGSTSRSLVDQLCACGKGQLCVECAASVEDARQRLREHQYDLVFGSAEMAEQLRSGVSPSVPVPFFAFDTLLHDASTKGTIQSVLCNHRRGCDPADPCIALSVLSTLAKYQKEKQRQSTEELLHKLRRTVEQSPDLVMITGSSGIIEYVNPAFESLTGYSSREVIGQTLGILKSEQQPGDLYKEMWSTVLSGQVFHGTVTNRKKNGENFVVQKAITPLLNAQGEITHFISTGRDITEQRKLEAQLQQAQKMDAIGRLAGGVAHDFNNLLMVISAYAELMTDTLNADHPLRHNVDEIINASRRAADLTRQLLAFGRKQVQSLQVLDLNKIMTEVSGMLPRLVGEDIQLSFIAGSDLRMVKADPTQIEQIIMNLAANARDAMPSGGKLSIETKNVTLDDSYVQERPMVKPGDYVQLSVTDTGAGISKEDLAHIFEPFFTTKEKGKGTGLGLATVYGIVKQSGGFIWVYSEPGMGTTFKIYLPQANSEMHEKTSVPAAASVCAGSETILLVEDELAVRQSTREFLVRSGYTVLEAQDGEEALQVSRDYCGPIHILLTDVVMPRMSGPKVAEQLAAERPQIKVLFVSGYAEQTLLRHGTAKFTAHLMQKPFCLNALASKIRELVESESGLKRAAAAS